MAIRSIPLNRLKNLDNLRDAVGPRPSQDAVNEWLQSNRHLLIGSRNNNFRGCYTDPEDGKRYRAVIVLGDDGPVIDKPRGHRPVFSEYELTDGGYLPLICENGEQPGWQAFSLAQRMLFAEWNTVRGYYHLDRFVAGDGSTGLAKGTTYAQYSILVKSVQKPTGFAKRIPIRGPR